MKKIFYLLLSMFVFVRVVNAKNEIILSEETKFFKTIITNSDNQRETYTTFEITKQEYDNYEFMDQSKANPIETEYKKMTTSISSSGSYYKYKVVLEWKKNPSTRSYDIIGIGYKNNVKYKTGIYFKQTYCTSSTSCSYEYTYEPQYFTQGVGASFKLKTGTYSSIKQELSFYVEKNTSSTITQQKAYGDYSHAQRTISSTNARNYTVNSLNGIILDSSISTYYDAINVATATWNGTW